MSETESDADDGTCPICGQPYDHKREEKRHSKPRLREDATACKTARVGGRRTVYVHVGTQTAVSRVVKESGEDRLPAFGGLFA